MAFESFREFLKQLDNAGELRRFDVPVATELEITELADREMKKPGGGQALLQPPRALPDALQIRFLFSFSFLG